MHFEMLADGMKENRCEARDRKRGRGGKEKAKAAESQNGISMPGVFVTSIWRSGNRPLSDCFARLRLENWINENPLNAIELSVGIINVRSGRRPFRRLHNHFDVAAWPKLVLTLAFRCDRPAGRACIRALQSKQECARAFLVDNNAHVRQNVSDP